MMSAITGVKPEPMYTVMLPESSCPTWISSCTFTATIQNGRLVAALVNTKGRDVEKSVGTELRGEYGNRVSMQQRIITPNDGSKEFNGWKRSITSAKPKPPRLTSLNFNEAGQMSRSPSIPA